MSYYSAQKLKSCSHCYNDLMLQTMTLKLALILPLGVAPLMSGQGFLFVGNDQPGHYQVTEDVAREFGFSRPAQLLLADAVIDPDFYEWRDAAAHAQTDNDPQGKQSETEATAIRDLSAWLNHKLGKVSQNLQTGHTREALYWLGYSLHAVEDLAAHEGITNAQHAFLSATDHNPDLRPEALIQARAFAKKFLWAVSDKLGAQNWKRLLEAQFPPLSGGEKDLLIGHNWDLSLGELLLYKAQGDFYKTQRQRSEIAWDTNKVLDSYLATLK